jgi:hypothetical protein
MRAGLQRHHERGAARAIAGRAQRVDFGVGPAELGVESLGDDLVALEQHGADEGIRRYAPPTPPREVQGAPHRGALGGAGMLRS